MVQSIDGILFLLDETQRRHPEHAARLGEPIETARSAVKRYGSALGECVVQFPGSWLGYENVAGALTEELAWSLTDEPDEYPAMFQLCLDAIAACDMVAREVRLLTGAA